MVGSRSSWGERSFRAGPKQLCTAHLMILATDTGTRTCLLYLVTFSAYTRTESCYWFLGPEALAWKHTDLPFMFSCSILFRHQRARLPLKRSGEADVDIPHTTCAALKTAFACYSSMGMINGFWLQRRDLGKQLRRRDCMKDISGMNKETLTFARVLLSHDV